MRNASSIAILVGAVVLLCMAGSRNTPLLQRREAEGLGSTTALDNAPPMVAFTTVALGGFRGILADVLWLRASQLQNEGRYFELVQLADWITKLEPRCTEIWAYHAWNMAYNVSVTMTQEEDRWRWVQNGISLLRDEGMLYNPGSSGLYRELGWMFQHKIGGDTDAFHEYYKMRWALEMTRLLGGASPDYVALKSQPERVRRMEHDFGLKPDVMQEVDRICGPLDWRLAQSHAVYWAYRGRKRASGRDILPCDRMIYQSMAALCRKGKLVLDPVTRRASFAPNPDLIEPTCRAYEQALASHGTDVLGEPYANFLETAVVILYRADRLQEARRIFEKLHTRFPSPATQAGFDAFLVTMAQESARRTLGPLPQSRDDS